MNDIIKMTMGELSIALEGEVMKAVQKVGIDVDKDKLLEALQLADTIVRCKECKHWHKNTEFCDKFSFGGYVAQRMTADDFCSYGERRDDDDR